MPYIYYHDGSHDTVSWTGLQSDFLTMEAYKEQVPDTKGRQQLLMVKYSNTDIRSSEQKQSGLQWI